LREKTVFGYAAIRSSEGPGYVAPGVGIVGAGIGAAVGALLGARRGKPTLIYEKQ